MIEDQGVKIGVGQGPQTGGGHCPPDGGQDLPILEKDLERQIEDTQEALEGRDQGRLQIDEDQDLQPIGGDPEHQTEDITGHLGEGRGHLK